ncbi:MAG TPA: ACT domain-containing protein [Syntrophomonadaceae bacterium]|nr:ACT domain-containing protein [Syntrophomonadaceae bacterium]HNX29148.1 ACT domain-containing protein [Syntrophomonadaceae bacterium]HPR93679.1 ACT domain-containing protein [Syntrophomonadaceae bacterium]
MGETEKIIITVLGHDQVGIIAKISAILAQNDINILDISQTILQGFFTMVMVADIAGSKLDVGDLKKLLQEQGTAMNLEIAVQHEDIFKFMHRI